MNVKKEQVSQNNSFISKSKCQSLVIVFHLLLRDAVLPKLDHNRRFHNISRFQPETELSGRIFSKNSDWSCCICKLTDTGEDSKLVHRRKRPKVDPLFSSLFSRRVRATSMTQRRVENTRVHFWTFSPVSVKFHSQQ